MKTIFFIFLSVFSIANGQNKKTNNAVKDITLKIPEGYTKRKWVESSPICGTDDYVYVPDADNYAYGFYNKNNQIYCQGKLTNIDGSNFKRIGPDYFKNNTNVYYYTWNLGLKKIEGIDVASANYSDWFIADKNYLYIKTSKVIESTDLKLISDYIIYKEGVSTINNEKNFLKEQYYLFKNIKGYWIVKSSDIVSYNFLGKTYSHKWDIVYKKEEAVYSNTDVDVLPNFPGGISGFNGFVNKNFKVEEKDLKGKIYSTFIIEKNGTLSDIKILQDLGYGTGKELIRVLKLSPKWNPGIKDGKKVRCFYSIPYTVNTSLD
ncbi:energy transducer TonB [Flavobacterium ajazii]|uniref:energy transducer TonB n=1 Tax=Flavobacterium ajazii TaxID=2692318 RepID=UPI0013D0CC2C|nr:energy transducer TonB [Flavobacterium ajazii]